MPFHFPERAIASNARAFQSSGTISLTLLQIKRQHPQLQPRIEIERGKALVE
jgi:hypothetical protein